MRFDRFRIDDVEAAAASGGPVAASAMQARQRWIPRWRHYRDVLSTGCQWRYIPKDLPPKSTVHDYLTRWNYDRTIEKIHYALYVQCREATGREASPTACVIDSQSVKSAEKGGPASIRPAMMRARKSKARSDISWSTR
jgi:hypothetical protein